MLFRNGRQSVEEARRLVAPPGLQPGIPVAECRLQSGPEACQRVELPIDFFELARRHRADFAAGGPAAIASAQEPGQLVQAEADVERPLDEEHAGERLRRVGAIPVGKAPRRIDEPAPFVMAQGIGADSRFRGELSRTVSGFQGSHDRQRKPRNRFEGQVLFWDSAGMARSAGPEDYNPILAFE